MKVQRSSNIGPLHLALVAASVLACGSGEPGDGTHDASIADGGSEVAVDALVSVDGDAPWSGPGADPSVWRPRVIYLVLPDRFANGNIGNDSAGQPDCLDPSSPTMFHGGDLAGLRAHIDYLTELGVSALWMTPLVEQEPRRTTSCGYHGYWADLTFPAEAVEDTLEPRMGTPGELDDLLAGLRAANVLPILDVVVNHPGRIARIVTEQPTWFHAAAGCAELGNPVHYCPLNGLPDFALERPEVAAYVTDVTTAWLGRYTFAGVRMDTAKHVPLDYFADSWMPAARAASVHPFVVAEVFSDGDIAQFAPYLDAGFDSFFHFPLRRALVNAIARGGSLDEVASVVADTFDDLGPERALMVTTFLDNHDVPRFMHEAGTLSDAERVRRYRLGLAALLTLPGIPQLYYGDELGMLGAEPDNRRDMPSWAFDPNARAGNRAGYLGNPAETFELTRSLIGLRNAHPALYEGYYSEMWRPNGNANLYSFYRASGEDRLLIVIHGGAGASGEIAMKFATKGTITAADRAAWPDGTVLTDLLGAGAPPTVTVQGGRIHVDMPGKTVGVYGVAP